MDATCHLRSVETPSKEGAEVGQAGAGLLKLPQAPPGYKRLDLSVGLRSQHHTARGKQLFIVFAAIEGIEGTFFACLPSV